MSGSEGATSRESAEHRRAVQQRVLDLLAARNNLSDLPLLLVEGRGEGWADGSLSSFFEQLKEEARALGDDVPFEVVLEMHKVMRLGTLMDSVTELVAIAAILADPKQLNID